MAKVNEYWKIDNTEIMFDKLYKAKEHCKSDYRINGAKINHYKDNVLVNFVNVSVDNSGKIISFSRPVKA